MHVEVKVLNSRPIDKERREENNNGGERSTYDAILKLKGGRIDLIRRLGRRNLFLSLGLRLP